MERLCELYGQRLLLSDATYHEPGVRETFCARCLDAVRLDARTEPRIIYSVLARRENASETQLAIERYSRDMVDALVAAQFETSWRELLQLAKLLPADDAALALARGRIAAGVKTRAGM